MTLATDIVAQLDSEGVGTSGTNVLSGPMRDGDDFPDHLITVLPIGGFPPVPDLTGPTGKDLRQKRVQIRVRSARQSYTAGEAQAEAVFEALHKKAPAGYVGWECDEPIYVEQDSKRRHHWSVNLTSTTHS